MSASGDVVSKLQQLENSPPTAQRAEAYNSTLSEIINSFSGSDLAANLVAYVRSILSDNIGVIASRPLLSAFVEQYRNLQDNDVKIEAGNEIIQLLAPKTVSFEQQDTDLKFALADAYEADEDFTNSAKTLQVITLDSSQRSVSDNEKAQVWIRICRCYLEEDNPTNAVTYLNRLKQIIYNVSDQTVKLMFQLSQARISDSMNQFLDASTAYYALSSERLIDEEERLHTLSAAITCAVLGPAGPTRARQLGRLYKDDRAADTPEFSILEKIFLDRLLEPAEVAAFASALPLATLIGSKYLVLHGGLFSDDKVTLDDIRKLNRHAQRQPGQAGLMMEMLWTDPQDEPGRGPSKRGVGMQFGPDVTKRFCENNGLEAVIRSHEVRMDGYEVQHDGRCITVFSAPRYCDSTENRGAYINIGPDYKLEFEQFDAVPHPDIKPMAYAQSSLMSSLM